MGSIPIPGTKRINHFQRRAAVNIVVVGVAIVATFIRSCTCGPDALSRQHRCRLSVAQMSSRHEGLPGRVADDAMSQPAKMPPSTPAKRQISNTSRPSNLNVDGESRSATATPSNSPPMVPASTIGPRRRSPLTSRFTIIATTTPTRIITNRTISNHHTADAPSAWESSATHSNPMCGDRCHAIERRRAASGTRGSHPLKRG
jgi:hypothetical protein